MRPRIHVPRGLGVAAPHALRIRGGGVPVGLGGAAAGAGRVLQRAHGPRRGRARRRRPAGYRARRVPALRAGLLVRGRSQKAVRAVSVSRPSGNLARWSWFCCILREDAARFPTLRKDEFDRRRYGWRYMQTDPQCDGGLAPGCYAPQPQAEPLTSDCPHECGGADRFCPTDREVRPTLVAPGHVTTGGTPTTRTGMSPAPPGTYAADGVQAPCPAGRFQPLSGQTRCDRACPPGHMCPEGSAEPTRCADGAFSLGLVAACTPCPHAPSASFVQTCWDGRYCCEF